MKLVNKTKKKDNTHTRFIYVLENNVKTTVKVQPPVGPQKTKVIKAASSDEQALATHAHRGCGAVEGCARRHLYTHAFI